MQHCPHINKLAVQQYNIKSYTYTLFLYYGKTGITEKTNKNKENEYYSP